MSSKHPRNDGPDRTPRRAGPTDEIPVRRATGAEPPVEPRGTDGDNGRPTVKSWQDVVKILVAVTVWFATTDAAVALREAAKYVDLGKTMSLLHLDVGGVPNIVLWGAVLGIAHGLILGIKALVFIWVGPTFFEYLYPVFVAASRISARLVTDVRKGWNDRTGGAGPGPGPGTMAPANAVIEPDAEQENPPTPRQPGPDTQPPATRPDGEPPPEPKQGTDQGKAPEDDRRNKDDPEPPK